MRLKTGLNWLKDGLDQDQSKDQKRPKKTAVSVFFGPGPVFLVLGNVWTGLGLGLIFWGQKTGLDWTFEHYCCQHGCCYWCQPELLCVVFVVMVVKDVHMTALCQMISKHMF